MGRLILNADDFGLTSGVNRAVIELHRAGAVTSATLMARAAATDEAIELARATPTLGVGCHVVLVDGEPVLASSSSPCLKSRMPKILPSGAKARIYFEPITAQLKPRPFKTGLSPRDARPTNVGAHTGRFHPTLNSFVGALLTGRIRSAEIEAETAAQIALLQSRGLKLTHIDTHKHVHIFPAVLRPVLRAAKAAGIGAVRNPFEPAWSRRATQGAGLKRRAEVRLLRLLEPAFRRIVAEEGFTTTDGAIGILATGKLNAANLENLLIALPSGSWELVTHPGYNDDDLAQAHTRLLASRQIEREALASLRSMDGIERIDFSRL